MATDVTVASASVAALVKASSTAEAVVVAGVFGSVTLLLLIRLLLPRLLQILLQLHLILLLLPLQLMNLPLHLLKGVVVESISFSLPSIRNCNSVSEYSAIISE